MGLPVLTATGAAPPARVATSLLAAARLAELAAPDPREYIERAVRLAQSPRLSPDMRKRVREDWRRTALFDARARVRSIESAWRAMADRARAGLPPESIEVPPTAVP
jgi:predicted O-linked N-acetylglucosamine transferase (SPINDLY family)